MSMKTGHGGKRAGAGRPKGSTMRRSDILADQLLSNGKCPVEALMRLADRAEAEGDLGQAIGAWKAIVPYVYPRPKSIEVDPEGVVELVKALTEAKAASASSSTELDYGEQLDRMVKAIEESETLH